MPSPIFPNKLQNSLNNSQMGSHYIPPVSPGANVLQSYQKEKKEVASENKIIPEESNKVRKTILII